MVPWRARPAETGDKSGTRLTIKKEEVMRKRIGHLLAAALACVMTASPALADYYAGKTVRVVVNLSMGGSTGIIAQIFSKHWADNIPGNPNLVVEAITGGAQMRGINFVRNAPRDGLTIGWLAGVGGVSTVGSAQFQQAVRDFVPTVLGGGGMDTVLYGRVDVAEGFSPEQIVETSGTKLGGYRAGSALDLLARMGLDLLEVDYDYVNGYPGGSDLNAALRRDEIQMAVTGTPSFVSQITPSTVATGEAVGYWYYTPVGEDGNMWIDPAYEGSGVRPFMEVYRDVKGSEPEGAVWEAMKWLVETQSRLTWSIVAPVGTPEEYLEILRESFVKTVESEAYQQEVVQRLGVLTLFDDASISAERLQRTADLDPEVSEVIQRYIREGER